MPTVGLLAPMSSERRAVVRAGRLRRDGRGAGALWRGRTGGVALVAGQLGVGPDVAARTTARFLDRVAVTCVLVVGVAGGVDDDVPIGTVVVPAIATDARTGTDHHATSLGTGRPAGRVVTGAELLTPANLKTFRRRGALAVDMETAAVAAVCEERGLPWAAFRAVSDRPSDGLVDDAVLALLRPDGSADLGAVLRYVATGPRRLPGLVRMGRDLRTATLAAARAAIEASAHVAPA